MNRLRQQWNQLRNRLAIYRERGLEAWSRLSERDRKLGAGLGSGVALVITVLVVYLASGHVQRLNTDITVRAKQLEDVRAMRTDFKASKDKLDRINDKLKANSAPPKSFLEEKARETRVEIQSMEEAEASLMDYEGFVAQGSMVGSGGVIVFDDQQCMVKQIARLARFYAHESCAQCTQCREGTAWTTRILERIERGEGTMKDLETLLDIGDSMTGKTICVLSDSCATPVVSGLKHFRKEFENHITQRRCPMRNAA